MFRGFRRQPAHSRALDRAIAPLLEQLEPRRMLSVAPAVPGTLNGKVVFAHAGHGYVWRGGTTWGVMRSYVNGMMEDHGNVDQLNFFAEHLLAAGATVVPLRPVGHQLNEVIVDNAGPGFAIQSGGWTASSGGPYWSNNNGNDAGNNYQFATTAASETAVARFTPNIPATGFYPVYAWANPGGTDNRVEDQIYRINYTGGSKEVKVATRLVGNGWIYLGNYYFTAGSSGNVEVSNKSATAGKVVIADAIRFGNGMGDYDPDGAGPAPISGQPREEECSLYWCYQSRGWTAPGVRVNDDEIDSGSTTLTSEEINFTAPAKWSEYMNNGAFGDLRDRVYLAFHSDASSNLSARGTTGLITGDATPNQAAFAQLAGSTVETEMTALNSTHEFAWGVRGDTVTGGYGEIGNGNLGGEMDGTIIEVAFHTNTSDASLMKDPKVRNDVGRTAVHVITKYFDQFDLPWVNNGYAPEAPTNVRATTNASGQVTLAWSPGASSAGANGPYGNAATGYRVWTSTNGYGFDLAATLGNVTSTTLSGLSTSAVTYFMVTAINAAGESLKSWTVAAKPQANRRASILIVNNYARLDRQGDKIESEYFGDISRVYLRHNNTFDYVVQAGEAIENYNSALGIETATDDAIAAGQIVLSNYRTVIWMSGEQSTTDETFSSTTQSLVANYLSAGGRMFVSGAEVAWDLFGQAGETAADQAFLADTLRSTYVGDDAGTYTTAAGIAGSALAGVPALSFDNGTHGTYDVDFADVLGAVAGSGASVAMNYSTGAGNGAVIQWTGAGVAAPAAGRLLFMGFPFESIYTASQRNALMTAALNFFGTAQSLAPTSVDLLAATDSGSSSTDNRTNYNNSSPAKALQFQVNGTIPGATVSLYTGITGPTTLLGSAVATGTTTIITTNGSAALSNLTYAVVAKQTEPGLSESAASGSLPVTIDANAPAAPGALTSAITTATSVALDWPNNGETDIWGYRVHRASTSGGPYTNISGGTPLASSAFTDNTVAEGQTYFYVLTTVDTAGNESNNGGEITIVPLGAPGTPDLVAASDTGSSNTDNWTRLNNASPATTLQFDVSDVADGATVTIYANGVAIGSGVASGNSVTVTTNGTTTLPNLIRLISAKQTLSSVPTQSVASADLSVAIDAAAPTASPPFTPDPTRHTAQWTFEVPYSDNSTGIDPATFDNNDITVRGPNGYAENGAFQSYTEFNGIWRATYVVPAPGGSWNVNNQGTYTIEANAGEVADVAGNFVSAGVKATRVWIFWAWTDAGVLHVDLASGGSTVNIVGQDAQTVALSQPGSPDVQFTGSFTSIVVHGTAGDDTLNFTGPVAQPITFSGGAGNDQLNVLSGTFTFANDAATDSDHLGVHVAAGAAVVFDATQRLRDLDVDGTATLTQGAAKVIVTRGLAVAGRLDLTDNDLVLDFDDVNGNPFSTTQDRIAAAYNFGAWDSDGIRTSMTEAASGLTTLGIGDAVSMLGLGASDTAEFSGVTVDGTSILIKYTYAGDANLDGVIDGGDYGIIDNFVQVPGANGYFNGDFNFDGVVDGGDYGIIDNNIQAQGGPL